VEVSWGGVPGFFRFGSFQRRDFTDSGYSIVVIFQRRDFTSRLFPSRDFTTS
jgi:hypothetical protein